MGGFGYLGKVEAESPFFGRFKVQAALFFWIPSLSTVPKWRGDGFVVVVVAMLPWIGWVGQDCRFWRAKMRGYFLCHT